MHYSHRPIRENAYNSTWLALPTNTLGDTTQVNVSYTGVFKAKYRNVSFSALLKY